MAIHGKEYRKVVNALATEQEYKGGSALTIRKSFNGWGSFPTADGQYPVQSPHGNSQVRTWVYSYATPIAWVYSDGTVYVPDHRYSNTTSGHQGLCRSWLARGERVY